MVFKFTFHRKELVDIIVEHNNNNALFIWILFNTAPIRPSFPHTHTLTKCVCCAIALLFFWFEDNKTTEL